MYSPVLLLANFTFIFEVSPTGIRVTVPKIYCKDQKPRGGLGKVNFRTSETCSVFNFTSTYECTPQFTAKNLPLFLHGQTNKVILLLQLEKLKCVNPLFKIVAFSGAFAVLPSRLWYNCWRKRVVGHECNGIAAEFLG